MAYQLVDLFNKKSNVDIHAKIDMLSLTDPAGYKVISFKAVKSTKTGERCVVALIDSNKIQSTGSTLGEVFLPRRFVSLFDDDVISAYNKMPNLHIKFCGIGKNNEYLVELQKNAFVN